MRRFTTRMQQLLDMLRDIERNDEQLSADEFEKRTRERTNYKGIATYRSKYLDDRLVFPCGNGSEAFYVKGALAITEEDFREILTQKKSEEPPILKYATQDEWIEAIRELAERGLSRGFRLDSNRDGDLDLFFELFEEE